MNEELKIKIRNLITGIYLTGYDQGLHESESPIDVFYESWEEKFIDILKDESPEL